MRNTKSTKTVSVVLVVLMLMSIVPFTCLSTSAQTREPSLKDGYYQISDLAELYWFAEQVNSGNTDINAKLTADIDVNEGTMLINTWTPIGNTTHKYNGTFDGNNHTVNGVLIDNSTLVNAGFFGVIENAEVKNLNLTNVFIRGNNVVGGICGSNKSGKISRCSVQGQVVSLNNFAGGICGENYGTISECYSSADVTAGFMYAGGICGENYSIIQNCYSSSDCLVSVYYYGGIYGGSKGGSISNCYYDSSINKNNKPYTTDTTITNVSGKSTSAFKSGEIAYLLNNGVTDGTQAFYQNLDNNKINDTYPVFENNGQNTVFKSKQDGYELYSNSENTKYIFKKNSDGYFVIENYEQLCAMADRINKSDVNYTNAKYILANDIDCRGGKAWVGVTTFNGVFDGNDCTISNLNVDSGLEDGNRHGLFATIGENGVVKNLTVSNASVFSSNTPVEGSGVIAKVNNGEIETCVVENSSVQLGNWTGLGGIAGVNNGSINNCGVVNTSLTRRWGGSSSTCDKSIGGITEINNGSVTNCFTYNCTFTNGNATSKGGVISSGNAPINCYYFTDSEVSTSFGTAKTVEEFASGEVTYLLNNGVTDGTQKWYQNITNDKEKDSYPKRIGGIVFKNDDGKSYSNTTSYPFLVTEDNYLKYGISEDYIGYYLISDIDGLFWFAEQVNNERKLDINILLLNDINNTDKTRTWTPIGTRWDSYSGIFDGNNHTISGLTITDSHAGMFAYSSGTIKNLKIKDTYVPTEVKNGYPAEIGGIVFENNGTIENCSFDSVIEKGSSVGGICYYNYGSIINCTSSGDFTSEKNIGGICYNNYSVIKGCTNFANLTSSRSAGGITSYNEGTIDNCHNEGNVSLDESLCSGSDGSLVGGIVSQGSGKISNSTNSGEITGIFRCGGIAGSFNGSIENCSNTGSIKGEHLLGGICGQLHSNCTISNCDNSGNVTGTGPSESSNMAASIGGICGMVDGSLIDNCVNTGYVSCPNGNSIGGICGYVDSTTVENCVNKGDVIGQKDVDGICGYTYNSTIDNCTNEGYVSTTI